MTKKKSEDIKKKSEKIDKKIEKISKTFPKSAKYSIAAITSLVVLGGLMMIPINARTTVSRVLDGTGFHKQAVAVDNIYREDSLVSLLSSVDKSSDKSCKSL